MVSKRCVIKLMTKTVTKVNGMPKRNYTDGREVYATQSGVGRTEFYKAAAVGMTPTVRFEVFDGDYKEERIVEHDGKLFRVIRTYPLPGRKVELVCQGESPNDD